jgi:hypothetical protein
MKVSAIFLICVILSFFLIPAAQAQEDLVKTAQRVSVTPQPPSTAILGTKESMYQYEDWLNSSIAPLISLFNQIMTLFGLQNTSYTQKMQDAFQMGLHLVNSSNKTQAL